MTNWFIIACSFKASIWRKKWQKQHHTTGTRLRFGGTKALRHTTLFWCFERSLVITWRHAKQTSSLVDNFRKMAWCDIVMETTFEKKGKIMLSTLISPLHCNQRSLEYTFQTGISQISSKIKSSKVVLRVFSLHHRQVDLFCWDITSTLLICGLFGIA